MRKKKSKKNNFWPILVSILAVVVVLALLIPSNILYKTWPLKGLKTLVKKGRAYYYGQAGEPVVWPTGHAVRGIDVSRYQTHVSWPEVKAANISFAFIKASEGFYRRDPLFDQHWEESGKAGILRGAYHFFRPSQPAALQALNFISAIDLEPGNLPPVLDIETIDDDTEPEKLREGMKNWLELVEKKYDVKPIIYTNYNFYENYLAGFFNEYPLWIAHYEVPRLRIKPGSGINLQFWQHTDRGAVKGVQGRVDCNVFYGNIADLKNLCLSE